MLEGKHYLDHQLHRFYDELKSFVKKDELLASDFYASHSKEILDVIDGVEYDNTLSVPPVGQSQLRVVTWNIERGKQLDGIIELFKEDEALSKADVIIAIECDNGMGRTSNRNVAKELAEALGLNYCFAPSYLVLGKGALGETDHAIGNTKSLHGTAILSRYKILGAEGVKVPPVKEVFHSSEKRLGVKKGLVASIDVEGTEVALGGIHVDLSSTAQDRGDQLNAVIEGMGSAPVKVLGGDWNCSTFNLRNKLETVIQVFSKLLTIGFKVSVDHYMTPELKFDKPLFETLNRHGFTYNNYNDRSKGTLHFDLNDPLTDAKTRKFIPDFLMGPLHRKLRPWNGCVPLKLDWLTGKGAKVITAETIDKPKKNGVMLSDHNPIFVDIQL